MSATGHGFFVAQGAAGLGTHLWCSCEFSRYRAGDIVMVSSPYGLQDVLRAKIEDGDGADDTEKHWN